MKIHSNVLTREDLVRAAAYAQVRGVFGFVYLDATPAGSRSHSHAFDVHLRGDGSVSTRPPNRRTYNAQMGERLYAGTWCQWGDFLGYLYRLDPEMKAGQYLNMHHFDDLTDGAFRTDDPNGLCGLCSACDRVQRRREKIRARRASGSRRPAPATLEDVYNDDAYGLLDPEPIDMAPRRGEYVAEVSQADIVARIDAELARYTPAHVQPHMNGDTATMGAGNLADDPCGYRFV